MIQKLILLIGVIIFLTFSKIVAGNISMLMNLKAAGAGAHRRGDGRFFLPFHFPP